MKNVRVKDFLLGMFVVVMWAALCVAMLNVWAEHPAEQPITESAYVEMMGGEAR